MEDKKINPEESLHVIQEMINQAKLKMNETGFHFLLWGVLVISASLTQYFMIKNGYAQNSNFVWLIMGCVGAPIAIVYESKRSKKQSSSSRLDRIYGLLWLGFGITLILTIFISISYKISPVAFILVMIGLVTFMSSMIYRFLPLLIGSIIFWLCAGLCPFFTFTEQLIVNSCAILLGYIVPGIILWKKNKENV